MKIDCTEVLSLFFTAIPVTIGTTRSLYSVNEDSGSVSICIDVLSGNIAGRIIRLHFQTVDGDAIGKYS